MSEAQNLKKDIAVVRCELKNVRQEVVKIKALLKSEKENIKSLLSKNQCQEVKEKVVEGENKNCFSMVPIGMISSCFKNKNGIPRQPSLCQSSKATLEIKKTFFTNPEHSLIGLEQFPYIWILFVFHKNGPENSIKAKVHPPRLDGSSVGVFSTRSPHRPCPIGLSLIKLDKIIGNKLYLSGVDLLDGTPILDVKPYIDSYDTPKLCKDVTNAGNEVKVIFQPKEISEDFATSKSNSSENKESDVILEPESKSTCTDVFNQRMDFASANNEDSQNHLMVLNTEISIDMLSKNSQDLERLEQNKDEHSTTASLLNAPLNKLKVIFTERAERDIKKFHSSNHIVKCEYCLHFIGGFSEAKKAIVEVLQNDPRSVYRRNKCADKLYFFEIDIMHVTCWFEDMTAEVLRVKSKC